MMKRKPFNKAILPLCIILAATGVLTACGSKNESTAAVEDGTTSISIMNVLYDAEPPKPDNEVELAIEKYTHTKLDMTFVPVSAYDDKVNATIASGELPNLMVVRRVKDPGIVNAMQSGLFWEVGPYLKQFPNLAKLDEAVLKNSSVDGKIFGVYRSRTLARYGYIYREDWLKQLGLEVPKTVDDIYKVAKAFTENDPDQNGQRDTFGMEVDSGLKILNGLTVQLGGPNVWGELDGKIQPDFMTAEYMQALELLKKMYNEGLINQDFPIAKKGDYIKKKEAGMYFTTIDDVNSYLSSKDQPLAVNAVQNISGPKGERIMATWGFDGMLMIPKTSVKTEDELLKVLDFVDKLADQPMQDLMEWGIEGTHYKIENGTATPTEGAEYNRPYIQLKWDDAANMTPGNQGEIMTNIQHMFKENQKLAIQDYSVPLTSETNNQKGKELQKIITDASVKYIVGQLDQSGWEAAVDAWRSRGGDQILEEFNAAYKP